MYHAPAAGAVSPYLESLSFKDTETNHCFRTALQKPPSRRSIPGAGFFSKLFSLLKWVFLIVIVVVAVMAYRGRKATRSAKRF